MNKIAYFNILPPKQEYIDKALKALDNNKLLLSQIIHLTKLSKTQVACTLESLINEKIVDVLDKNGKKYYFICKLITTKEPN